MSSNDSANPAATQIVECVPNFSEGIDRDKVVAIIRAMKVEGVHLLDWSMDPDHNRSVVTVAGAPAAVVESAVRGAGEAAKLIDLTRQTGQHPRIGAADVVPFVPVSGISLVQCAMLARQAGTELWRRYGVPVYLYEAAASRPDRVNLEDVRRGQFEGLARDVHKDSTRRPDIGGPELHGKAGASAIGARKFLIAYNLYLKRDQETPDIGLARAIAKEIRMSSGGHFGVKAMGVVVNARAQISMNITDFHRTPMAKIRDAVATLAEQHGAEIAEGELIGLIPEEAFDPAAAWVKEIPGFDAEQKVLERRLRHPLAWP